MKRHAFKVPIVSKSAFDFDPSSNFGGVAP